MVQTVAVTGASGFVGRALVAELLRRGRRVVALSRDPDRLAFPAEVERRRFDASDAAPQPAAFEAVDAVVHLAGESVAGRWTAAKKDAIANSRIAGTRVLVRSLARCEVRPRVLVGASASGYYGSRGDETLSEASPPGSDFLASVCVAWERETAAARALGIRVAMLRTGIVLDRDGGALAQMLPPFRLGLGGPFGSGQQFVPWIHRDDLVALYCFALEHDAIEGALNAVAPDYATGARFAQALGGAVGRPALVPAPRFALRAALGEFGDTLAGGQLMIPAKAEDAGFSWRYAALEEALSAIVRGDPVRRGAVRVLTAEQVVRAPLDDVFAFFSQARNLEGITPPTLGFHVVDEPERMRRGTQIRYRLRLRGMPVRWQTLIAAWEPPHRFVDVQMHGPYALWRHEHTFEPVAGGVAIRDHVRYALPLAPLSAPVTPLVAAEVRGIFDYRRRRIAARFG